jgi:hypothetical protein
LSYSQRKGKHTVLDCTEDLSKIDKARAKVRKKGLKKEEK